MKTRTQVLTMVATAGLASAAHAQFAITSFTIDGGGGSSSGGTFNVRGTIGQPDAGSPVAPLTGGTFSLVGGFWAGAAGGSR